MLKQLPSGLYFVALIFFFTPWWSAGCAGQKAISFTGVQTVTGFNLETVGGFDASSMANFGLKTKTEEVSPEPLVILALILALAALIAGLTVTRKSLLSAGTMGFIAGVLLLIFKARVDAKVLEEGKGAIQVFFESGFWATVACFFTAGVSQLLIAKQIEPVIAPIADNTAILPSIVKAHAKADVPRKSRAELIPTEPPPSKQHNDHRYMPPAMRADLDKKTGRI